MLALDGTFGALRIIVPISHREVQVAFLDQLSPGVYRRHPFPYCFRVNGTVN